MTQTDTDFTSRFPGMTAATFVANSSTLANYTPTENPFNTGMMSDIGRALIYSNDIFQNNFYNRFLRSPLQRGNAFMKGYFSEINSRAYNPLAPDTDLFNGSRPTMSSQIFVKNYSRQIACEVNDRLIKQYVQTPEMIGDAQAAIMSAIASCAADDLWTASKTYFSGSVRSAKADQMYTMTHAMTGQGEEGFGDELVGKIWDFALNKFRFKSDKYNAAGRRSYSTNVHVGMVKGVEYRGFRKLLADTFNPAYIDPKSFGLTFDWVDDFATPAGKPEGAGDLIAIIADDRVMDITPMPEGFVMESFRNPARTSTAFFQTTELAFGFWTAAPCAYIFAKGS